MSERAEPRAASRPEPRAIWVTGATGYIGRAVCETLAARGHDVVALARSAEKARGTPELARCRIHVGDLLEPATLRGAATGVDTVIHLVGILRERGAATFESVVVEGTAAVVAEARRAGARGIFYMSAIGADPAGPTRYFRTKARAEEMVRSSGLAWLVARGSIVLGKAGEFFRLLRDLTRFPVVPVPGSGAFELQPVLLEDVAEVMARAVERPEAWNRVYGVCGPRRFTLREMLRLASGRRARRLLSIPWPLVSLGAKIGERVLPDPPVTTDELAMLARGNVCDPGPVQRALGLSFRGVEELLAEVAA
jgi:NADH dehydrogenase